MATSGESLPVRGDKESHTPDLKEVDSRSTSLDLRHVERAATWKIDFVVVPIVGLFCQ